MFVKSIIFSIVLSLLTVPVFAGDEAYQTLDERRVSVHLEEAFDAGVSLIPFKKGQADYENPVSLSQKIKTGGTAVLTVPGQYLPGEFVLRLDYRQQESDSPYPAERIIFLNDQDISLSVNPPYINNDEKTTFNEGEKENTIYSAFMKENSGKRLSIELLRQLLMGFDRQKSEFYQQAREEFERLRIEYNQWLKEQAREHPDLFVSRLFQFQHISFVNKFASEKEYADQLLSNYFEGVDLTDPLIIRFREMSRFMDVYMRLYGGQAENREESDKLFVLAGQKILEISSKAHPDVRDWMIDYLRRGYEKEGLEAGLEMLEKAR